MKTAPTRWLLSGILAATAAALAGCDTRSGSPDAVHTGNSGGTGAGATPPGPSGGQQNPKSNPPASATGGSSGQTDNASNPNAYGPDGGSRGSANQSGSGTPQTQ